jgi:hypothetical protein
MLHPVKLPEGPVLFRVVDATDYHYGHGIPRLHHVQIISETEKTWLVQDVRCGPPRRALKKSHKRYACTTVEEAWESYVARKRKHCQILAAQHEATKERLLLACRELASLKK